MSVHVTVNKFTLYNTKVLHWVEENPSKTQWFILKNPKKPSENPSKTQWFILKNPKNVRDGLILGFKKTRQKTRQKLSGLY